MKNQKERTQYLQKLSSTGREKSLLGEQAEAAEYFIKAIEWAETSEHFLCITKEIYLSDMQGNKVFAYTTFLRSIETAASPFAYFRKLTFRHDLAAMVSEFMLKLPDDLFHFILIHTKSAEEQIALAGIFEPLNIYISDPDPSFFLSKALKKAS